MPELSEEIEYRAMSAEAKVPPSSFAKTYETVISLSQHVNRLAVLFPNPFCSEKVSKKNGVMHG